MEFIAQIQKWYNKHARELPWRKTQDPYVIWISEIILQQTRVNQGLPYFERFIERFPNVQTLANATEQEVLKYWQGLGYYSRARNLHAAAKQIILDFNGVFPATYNQLIKLKGIGEYTAAAIASFAYNEKQPVLDGNVFRIMSRYLGIKEPIDKPKTKKIFYAILNELIENQNPSLFNQAVMEFGALQCKPVNPNCQICPVKATCFSFNNNMVNELPYKASKTKVKEEFWYYMIIKNKNQLLFRYRYNKGIWKNLYDFLCIENEKELTPKQLIKRIKNDFAFLNSVEIKSLPIKKTHLLSHKKLNIYFVELESERLNQLPNYLEFKSKTSYKKLPLPRIIDEYLTKHFKW